jgi:hypothetical protein
MPKTLLLFFFCFVKFWSYKFPSLCICLDIGMKFWAMTVKLRGVGHVGEHCEQCKYINRTFIGGWKGACAAWCGVHHWAFAWPCLWDISKLLFPDQHGSGFYRKRSSVYYIMGVWSILDSYLHCDTQLSEHITVRQERFWVSKIYPFVDFGHLALMDIFFC